jgi:hypothetical protein
MPTKVCHLNHRQGSVEARRAGAYLARHQRTDLGEIGQAAIPQPVLKTCRVGKSAAFVLNEMPKAKMNAALL